MTCPGRTPVLLAALLAVLLGCACSQPGRDDGGLQQTDTGAAILPAAVDVDTPSAAPLPSDSPAGDTAGREPAPSAAPGAAQDTATGRLAVTGTDIASFAVLQVEGQRALVLSGELEPELRRLSGATLRVFGRIGEETPFGTRFEVRRYEVLAIDGRRPQVGELLARGGGLWLATDSDTLRLAGAPPELASESGARVWVVGPVSAGTLQLQSYGVIRPR